jgi:hypothetical protein
MCSVRVGIEVQKDLEPIPTEKQQHEKRREALFASEQPELA